MAEENSQEEHYFGQEVTVFDQEIVNASGMSLIKQFIYTSLQLLVC